MTIINVSLAFKMKFALVSALILKRPGLRVAFIVQTLCLILYVAELAYLSGPGIQGERPHLFLGDLGGHLRGRVLPADQLLGVEDAAELPDVSPLGLVAVDEGSNLGCGVARDMNLTN